MSINHKSASSTSSQRQVIESLVVAGFRLTIQFWTGNLGVRAQRSQRDSICVFGPGQELNAKTGRHRCMLTMPEVEDAAPTLRSGDLPVRQVSPSMPEQSPDFEDRLFPNDRN